MRVTYVIIMTGKYLTSAGRHGTNRCWFGFVRNGGSHLHSLKTLFYSALCQDLAEMTFKRHFLGLLHSLLGLAIL